MSRLAITAMIVFYYYRHYSDIFWFNRQTLIKPTLLYVITT